MANELSVLSEPMTKAAFAWVYGDDDGKPITSKAALARYVGISQITIAKYFDSPVFQDEVDRLLKMQKRENDRTLMRHIPAAMNTLIDIMNNAASARDRYNAATKILSIGGYGDNQTLTVNVNDTTGVIRGGFGRQTIEKAETVIDVDYEEVSREDPDEVPVDEV